MLDIREYFGVPILRYDIEGDTLNQIQKEIEIAIPEIKQLNLDNPWDDTVHTSFKFGIRNADIDAFNLNSLKNQIIEKARMMYPGYLPELNESWFNFSYKGNFQFDHEHGNAKISGAYYYQTNGFDGNIKFKNPNVYERMGLGINRGNSWLSVEPKVGRLVLFPSYLEHRVEPNLCDSERISISFNLD